MTDATGNTQPTETGRKLWENSGTELTFDTLVHDGEAFACAMFDAIGVRQFSPLNGDGVGGDAGKRYDAKLRELHAYLETHEVDPELRALIAALEDQVNDFATETFSQGVTFATATERFRRSLQAMTTSQ